MAPPLEISIPTTTTSSTSPPYTLYNITIRLPLRTFIVQKRYSDFDTLDDTLKKQLGDSPPLSLPPKGWKLPVLGLRTGIDTKKVEERRQSLARYLCAIVESGDARFRNTSAWRTFLNLPSASTISSSSATSAHSAISSIGNLEGGGRNLDAGAWLDVYREAKQTLHDARLWLGKRDGATSTQGQHEAGSGAKRCLVKSAGVITVLEEGLESLQKNQALGDGELRRRKDLVAGLRQEREGLEKLNSSMALKSNTASSSSTIVGASTNDSSKSSLFGASTRKGGRVLGAPAETDHTRELDNTGVLQLQQQMMREQDIDVEQLAKIVKRQKEMGIAISEEIEVQNEMLARLDGDVDRVEGKIDIAKKRAQRVR